MIRAGRPFTWLPFAALVDGEHGDGIFAQFIHFAYTSRVVLGWELLSFGYNTVSVTKRPVFQSRKAWPALVTTLTIYKVAIVVFARS